MDLYAGLCSEDEPRVPGGEQTQRDGRAHTQHELVDDAVMEQLTRHLTHSSTRAPHFILDKKIKNYPVFLNYMHMKITTFPFCRVMQELTQNLRGMVFIILVNFKIS